MTDQTPPVETGATAEAGQTPAFTPEQTQAYVKQLRDEAKKHRLAAEAAQAKLTEYETKQREADAEKLQKEGQFKTLYEQKRAEAEKLAEQAKHAEPFVEAFRKSLEQRIERLPEVNRSMVPKFDNPLDTAAWLDENESKLGARPFPNLNPGAGASTGTASGNGTGAQVNEVEVQQLMKIAKVKRERAIEMLANRNK